jgi:hypothetical protein
LIIPEPIYYKNVAYRKLVIRKNRQAREQDQAEEGIT